MKSPKIVNESEKVTLTRVIDSNPLSIVMWYWKGMVLKTENMTIRNIASYTIEEAKCYDTKNFTIIASNGVEKNATDLVELRVNCEYYCFSVSYRYTTAVVSVIGTVFDSF